MNTTMSLFQGKQIRKVLHQGEWWFVVDDVVSVLTDSVNVKDYIKKMRNRDEALAKGWGQIVTPLSMETTGGVQKLNCANTGGVFRIIQSIPSPKAEPFKIWLAKVGYERVQEIENPELAMDRMRRMYERKGYPASWIEKRIRGIAVRQDLTAEWSNRGADTDAHYAMLTNEIMQATFGLGVQDYKQVKGLKCENLRDHMVDMELILTMLGEATTTTLTRTRDSQGVDPLKKDARDGGSVAGRTRKDIEAQSGLPVVTAQNFKNLSAAKHVSAGSRNKRKSK